MVYYISTLTIDPSLRISTYELSSSSRAVVTRQRRHKRVYRGDLVGEHGVRRGDGRCGGHGGAELGGVGSQRSEGAGDGRDLRLLACEEAVECGGQRGEGGDLVLDVGPGGGGLLDGGQGGEGGAHADGEAQADLRKIGQS